MKFTKILSSLCACAVLCLCPELSVMAEEPEEKVYNGLVYQVSEDGTEITIISYTEDMPSELVIPSEIDGIPVKYFSQMAFYHCDALTEVTIPDTVESFGFQTFLNCSNLKTVHFPEGLTSIYESAFAMCTSLESVILPESLTTIGNLVFSGCTSLSEISIPEGVTEFGEPAFTDTPWLAAQQAKNPFVIVNHVLLDASTAEGEEITIPEGVTSIAPWVFGQQEKNIKKVIIPDGVTTLNFGALDCPSLEEIVIPESVQTIKSNAFSSTVWLANRKAENPLVVVNQILIDGTEAENHVVIPDSVRVINTGAFQFSENLTSVEIPETVTEIQDRAFWNCENLTSVSILNPDCKIVDSDSAFSTNWDGFEGIIRGYENSTAQAYAEKYGYSFEVLGENSSVEGDVSGDGAFNVADAVLLQKWLLGADDVHLADWKAADLCKDGRINIYDLIMMKKKLIYG